MKIDFCSIELPLIPELMLMGKRHTARHGILLRLISDTHIGYGEANPLPGLHQETIADVRKQLTSISNRVFKWPTPLNFTDVNALLQDVEKEIPLFPSLRFALEAALLQVAASKQHTLPPYVLNPNASPVIEINGLLAGEGGREVNILQEMLLAGCKTIKVKVGREEIDKEIRMVTHLSSMLPEDTRLRLDANQAWKIPDARRFMDGVGECAIEYLEEPLQNSAELHLLGEETPVPLALDESLASTIPEDVNVPNNVIAFILKPAVLGGAGPVFHWAKLAAENGADVVISGSFCSSVGLIAEAGIAAACSKGAVGLGTWRWLGEDVLSERFAPKEYVISTKEAFAKLQTLSTDIFSD